MASHHKLLAYAIAVAAILAFGVSGTYYFGQHGGFNVPMSLVNALYFTIATISTVGYGDITPVSPGAKAFVIVLIVLGISIIFGAIIGISGNFVNSEIERLSGRLSSAETRLLRNHTVLIGYHEANTLLAEELGSQGKRFVIAVDSVDTLNRLKKSSYTVIVADESSASELGQLGINRASRVVIDLPSRSKTVYTTLIIKGMAGPKTDIIVVTSSPETVKYLQEMGIRHIVNPAGMAATKISKMID